MNHTDSKDVVAVVYPCLDDATLREILKRGVFEWPRARFDHARHVKADDPLFVLVQETRRLWGIYKATQDVQIDTSGPSCDHCARVSFIEGHNCSPLPEEVYKHLISDSTGAISFLLNHKQRAALWTSFKLIKPVPPPQAPPVRTLPPPPPPVHPAQHNGPPPTARFYEDSHGQNPMSNASPHPYASGHAHATHASHHHVPMSDSVMHGGAYPPPPSDRRHRDSSSYGGSIHSPRHALPPPPPNVGRLPMDTGMYGRYPPPPGPYSSHEYVWDGRGWIPYAAWHRSRWENDYWSRGESSQPPLPRFQNGHPHAGSDSGLSGSVHRQGSDASDAGEKHRQQQVECDSLEEKAKLRDENEVLREKVELLETSLSELRSKNRESLSIIQKENEAVEEKLGHFDSKEAGMGKELELLRSSFAGMSADVECSLENIPPINAPSYQVHTPQVHSMMSTPLQSPRLQSPRLQSPRPQSPQLLSPRPQSPHMLSPRMQSHMPTPHNQSPRIQTPRAQSPAPQPPPLHSPQMYAQTNQVPRMQSPQPQVYHPPPQSISPAPQGHCVGGSGAANRVWTHSQGAAANDMGMRSRNHEPQSMRPQSPLTPRGSAGQQWGSHPAQGNHMVPPNACQDVHPAPAQASPYPVSNGLPSPCIPNAMASCGNTLGRSNAPSIPGQHLLHQNGSVPPQISQQQGPGIDNIVFGTSTLPPPISPTAPQPMQAPQVKSMPPIPAHHHNTSHVLPQPGPQNVLPVHQNVLPGHQNAPPGHHSMPPVHQGAPQNMHLPTPFQGNAVPRQQFGNSGGQPHATSPLNPPQSLPQPHLQQAWARTPQPNWGAPPPTMARPPASQCGSATPREMHSMGFCPSNSENTTPQPTGEEDMYILGGMNHGENKCMVEKYNNNGMWEVKGELPEGVSPLGGDACCLQENIFVLGLEGQKAPEEVGIVHRFDTRTGGWDRVATLKNPRKSLSCTVCNGKVVALGGQKPGFQEASDIVEIYDPERNTWIMGPNMNQARFCFDAVCVASCVFAVGGQQDKGTPLDTVELWDLRQKGWQTVKSMEVKRGFLSCAAYGESIFALGGCGLKQNVNMERRLETQASVETFDPRANKWTTIAPMSDTRAFGSAEYWGGYIWAIGGRRSMDDVGSMLAMERFDIREGKWKSGYLAGFSQQRAFHTTCIVKRFC
ncbi:hypothetical protein BSKO_12832 [Bryopsis sp. KO-2023]|nr:hypothetical protein BSKO_12832 [Bryopsis sp. KO-2023]